MPHRTTQWRWKTKGRPSSGRGRRTQNENLTFKTIVRAAILIEEAVRSPGAVDHKVALREAGTRQDWPDVKEIYAQISGWPFPADLLAVATCDTFHIGTRQRRSAGRIWTNEVIAQRLRKECPSLSKAEAMRHADAYVRGDEDTQQWVDWVLQPDKVSVTVDKRQCCVSKVFSCIKRRMACYWRKHSAFARCKARLSSLAWKARYEARRN
jgi:hypothetical protein